MVEVDIMDMEQEKEPLLARGGGRREKTDGTVKKDLPAVSSGSRSRGARYNGVWLWVGGWVGI